MSRSELLEFNRRSRALEKREERRRQSRPGGLIEFVRYFWDVLEPYTPLVDGWVMDAICEHLEAVTLGRIKKLLINVPPGFCKSLLTDVFWPAWEWSAMDMPGNRFVSFSYAADITEQNNSKFRDLVCSAKFQEMWGHRFKIKEDGKIRVSNDKTGTKFASSVGGVGTGKRGDRVIFDDPHNVKESESQPVREETTRWFREGMSNRLNSLTNSAIVVIMQRVHEADVSGIILTEYPDYEFLCIPMEFDPSRAHETSIGWSDPRTEVGELAWPERYPARELTAFKQTKFLWASQYQQSPFVRGGALIQEEWWRLWDDDEAMAQGQVPGKYPPFEYVIATVDGAFTEKTENDPSAMTVWGVWQDNKGHTRFMLVNAWAQHLAFQPALVKIAETAKKFKIDRLLIENKATGPSVAQEIRRLYSGTEDWATQLVDPKGLDKVQRVNAVSHFWECGLVYAPNTKWAQMTITQCSSFPKGAHDDLVDCCSMALKHFRDNGMAQLPDEAQIIYDESITHRKLVQRPLYPV